MKIEILKTLQSVKTTIVLLSIFAILCLIGSIFPQDLSIDQYRRTYGEPLGDVFVKLGASNVFHSLPFIAVLVLFSVNLFICFSKKITLKWPNIGFTLVHFAIFVIAIGAVIGAIWGKRGFMQIFIGQTVIPRVQGVHKEDLHFKVSLEDFQVEYYDELYDKVLVRVGGNQKNSVSPAKVGVPHKIKGSKYTVTVLRYVPDFMIDLKTKEVFTRGHAPNNPAIQVEIESKEGKELRWLFVRFPGHSQGTDTNIQVEYQKAPGEGIKDYKSHLKIEDGETVTRKVIGVNDPLQYKGYSFYQTSYDSEKLQWSGIQVARDPGVPIVYAGFILLTVGLIILFYLKPLMKKSSSSSKSDS